MRLHLAAFFSDKINRLQQQANEQRDNTLAHRYLLLVVDADVKLVLDNRRPIEGVQLQVLSDLRVCK